MAEPVEVLGYLKVAEHFVKLSIPPVEACFSLHKSLRPQTHLDRLGDLKVAEHFVKLSIPPVEASIRPI